MAWREQEDGPWATPKRLGRALLGAGAIYALGRARALRQDPVTVLMYHTIGANDECLDAWTVVREAEFMQQMAFLRDHYDIVDLDRALATRDVATRRGRPQAVVTFDDGDAGLYRHLLPYIESARVPVTVYVATAQIQTGRPFWFDRVMNAVQVSRPTTIDLRELGLGCWAVGQCTGPRNWEVIADLLAALKRLAPERRELVSEQLVARLSGEPMRDVTPLAPLDMTQLKELAASPWVTIGAHTHSHDLLDQIPLADARDSMLRSRQLLQEWTGQAVLHFAYPNGNHNADLVREVQTLGFSSALTATKGLWDRADAPHAVSRIPVGRYDDLLRFKLNLLGGRGLH